MKLSYTEFQQWLQQILAGGSTPIATAIRTTGDIDAAGGFRYALGPFVQTNVNASQAAVRLGLGATGVVHLDAVVPRAGSLVGITLSTTVAPAGSTATIGVFVDGALLHATAVLPVPAGAPLAYSVSFAKDTANLAIPANSRVGVAITTDGSWSATTADISVFVYVEG